MGHCAKLKSGSADFGSSDKSEILTQLRASKSISLASLAIDKTTLPVTVRIEVSHEDHSTYQDKHREFSIGSFS